MARKVRTFDKWRQGSGGSMDPGVVDYNSTNAQVYENGSLGERPGWKTLSTTGTETFATGADYLRGLQWARSIDDTGFLFRIFSDNSAAGVRTYDLLDLSDLTWEAGTTITYTSTTSVTQPPNQQARNKILTWNDGFTATGVGPYIFGSDETEPDATNTRLIVADDHIIDVDSTTVFTVRDAAAMGLAVGSVIDIYESDGSSRATNRTVTALVGNLVTINTLVTGLAATDLIMFDGSSLPSALTWAGSTRYRERVYYWGLGANPGRIYYSDAADPLHVQTLAFFDVSIDQAAEIGAVTGLYAIQNALIITRKDDKWLVLTGTSPENGTLRELGVDPVPDFRSGAVVDNSLYFLNRSGKGVHIGTPSSVDNDSLRHLSPLAYPGSTFERPYNDFLPLGEAADDVNSSAALYARVRDGDTIYGAEMVNGVWTLTNGFLDGVTWTDFVYTSGDIGRMYASYFDEAGGGHEVLSRDYTLNRPARSADSWSVALASEEGTSAMLVRLGETDAGEGKIVRPVKVVLDIDYWKGGTYTAPSLSIDAVVMGTESAASEDTIATQTVTTTGWGNTTSNYPKKRRVPVVLPNAQFGTSFYVEITGGTIALNSVQVYYDEQEDPR